MKKASGGDGILVELFQILKEMLLKCCTQYASKIGKCRRDHRLEKVSVHSNPKCQRMFKLPHNCIHLISVQFSSVTHSCSTLCDPMHCSTPGFPVHYQLPEPAQTHVCCVSDAIQPSHLLPSPYPLSFNLSQVQGLLKRISSLHQAAKVLEFLTSVNIQD